MKKKDNVKKTPDKAVITKQDQIKKQKQKSETARFKAKYFEYYDDIKISDRQDW